MDYAQEQADELEALSSIFADDLEGEPLLPLTACSPSLRHRQRSHSLLHLYTRPWLQRSGTASPWDGAPWDRCGEWW